MDSAEAMEEMAVGSYLTLAASVITLGRVRESKAELKRRVKSLSDTIEVSRSLSAEIRRRRGEVAG
jgi:hypothetical protein